MSTTEFQVGDYVRFVDIELSAQGRSSFGIIRQDSIAGLKTVQLLSGATAKGWQARERGEGFDGKGWYVRPQDLDLVLRTGLSDQNDAPKNEDVAPYYTAKADEPLDNLSVAVLQDVAGYRLSHAEAKRDAEERASADRGDTFVVLRMTDAVQVPAPQTQKVSF